MLNVRLAIGLYNLYDIVILINCVYFGLQTNTFQLVLVRDDDGHTFAIFNYGHQMDWAGAFGNLVTGLGGDAATVCLSVILFVFT